RVCSKCSMRSEPTTSPWFLTTRLWPTTSSVSGSWNRPLDGNYAWRPTPHNAEIRRSMEVSTPARQRSKIWPILGLVVAFVLAIVIWQHFTSPTPKAADRTTEKAAEKSPNDTIAVNEQQLKQISTDMVKQQLVTIDRNATGKVGFNEDRLTPVFTPFAGRT